MLTAELDSLIHRAGAIPQQRRRQRLGMYVQGLRARVDQIDYCIERMLALTVPADAATGVAPLTLDDNLQAEFYCDSFWTWVYSSLDILGQIINQALNLNVDEDRVSFNSMLGRLRNVNPQPAILPALEAIDRSHVRAWMNAYRNCANHRRPICLWHEIREQAVTRAYQFSTAPIRQVVRYISDHSVALTPNPRQRRELIPRCEQARDNLKRHLETAVCAIL